MYVYVRGNFINCVKIAPETAFKYVAFDSLMQAISKSPDSPTGSERFASGAMAGAISMTATYPLEVSCILNFSSFIFSLFFFSSLCY